MKKNNENTRQSDTMAADSASASMKEIDFAAQKRDEAEK